MPHPRVPPLRLPPAPDPALPRSGARWGHGARSALEEVRRERAGEARPEPQPGPASAHDGGGVS